MRASICVNTAPNLWKVKILCVITRRHAVVQRRPERSYSWTTQFCMLKWACKQTQATNKWQLLAMHPLWLPKRCMTSWVNLTRSMMPISLYFMWAWTSGESQHTTAARGPKHCIDMPERKLAVLQLRQSFVWSVLFRRGGTIWQDGKRVQWFCRDS